MSDTTNESIGEKFKVDLLQAARDKTLQVIEESAKLIKAGTTESDAKKIIADIQLKLGAPKSWHPPQIRFGENTLLSFGEKGVENPALKENDIFFLDIGPIFDEHEGDVGRAFTVGNNPEMRRCCEDIKKIWHEVRNEWAQKNTSGAELYKFAQDCAKAKGWILTLESANGHRVADFPHIAKSRGTVEELTHHPAANRWILEIQIRHPKLNFGAFYEDLLN